MIHAGHSRDFHFDGVVVTAVPRVIDGKIDAISITATELTVPAGPDDLLTAQAEVLRQFKHRPYADWLHKNWRGPAPYHDPYDNGLGKHMHFALYPRVFDLNGSKVEVIPQADADDVDLPMHRIKITGLQPTHTNVISTALATLHERFVGTTMADWAKEREQEINPCSDFASAIDSAAAIATAINKTLREFYEATGLKINRIDVSPVDGLTVQTVTVAAAIGPNQVTATARGTV